MGRLLYVLRSLTTGLYYGFKSGCHYGTEYRGEWIPGHYVPGHKRLKDVTRPFLTAAAARQSNVARAIGSIKPWPRVAGSQKWIIVSEPYEVVAVTSDLRRVKVVR